MQTDKRVTALIISFAMLASSFSMGVAFADETTETNGEEATAEYLEAEDMQQDTVTEEPTGEETEEEFIETEDTRGPEDAELLEELPAGTTANPQEDSEEVGSVEIAAADRRTQTIRVVLVLSATKRMLLKPDAKGKYSISSKIAKVRGSKTVKLLISNPAACPISFSNQMVASNTGGNFVDSKLTGCTVNDEQTIGEVKAAVEAAGGVMHEIPDDLGEPKEVDNNDEDGAPELGNGDDENEEIIDDQDALQVTEVTLKVNGTGEGTFGFKSQGSNDYLSSDGKIYIRQTRPTSEMSRTAKVRTKAGKPKAIPRKYKEKYFKIVKKGENDKVVYKTKIVTKAFEIKRASGISESGYRANQGGGTDGTYSYNALCKKGSSTYVKIVKTRLRDMKVVKVSKDLKLNHANDITYDPVNKRLVVTHNAVKRKRVTFVNPKTLKSMGYKDIKIPATLKGATKSQMSAVKGFASVTYMSGGKYAGNYIAIISGNHNFLVLNKNFKPIEYITVDSKFKGSQIYYQGADNIGDKLYVAIYPRSKKRRDFIVAYDMDGNFQGKVNLRKGYETENIFHVGNLQYMTLYRMEKKVWYTPKVVEKKVKLTKEEQKRAKKDKKGKKPKYKTVVKVVKEKHSKQVKRSFICRMKMVKL